MSDTLPTEIMQGILFISTEFSFNGILRANKSLRDIGKGIENKFYQTLTERHFPHICARYDLSLPDINWKMRYKDIFNQQYEELSEDERYYFTAVKDKNDFKLSLLGKLDDKALEDILQAKDKDGTTLLQWIHMLDCREATDILRNRINVDTFDIARLHKEVNYPARYALFSDDKERVESITDQVRKLLAKIKNGREIYIRKSLELSARFGCKNLVESLSKIAKEENLEKVFLKLFLAPYPYVITESSTETLNYVVQRLKMEKLNNELIASHLGYSLEKMQDFENICIAFKCFQEVVTLYCEHNPSKKMFWLKKLELVINDGNDEFAVSLLKLQELYSKDLSKKLFHRAISNDLHGTVQMMAKTTGYTLFEEYEGKKPIGCARSNKMKLFLATWEYLCKNPCNDSNKMSADKLVVEVLGHKFLIPQTMFSLIQYLKEFLLEPAVITEEPYSSRRRSLLEKHIYRFSLLRLRCELESLSSYIKLYQKYPDQMNEICPWENLSDRVRVKWFDGKSDVFDERLKARADVVCHLMTMLGFTIFSLKISLTSGNCLIRCEYRIQVETQRRTMNFSVASAETLEDFYKSARLRFLLNYLALKYQICSNFPVAPNSKRGFSFTHLNGYQVVSEFLDYETGIFSGDNFKKTFKRLSSQRFALWEDKNKNFSDEDAQIKKYLLRLSSTLPLSKNEWNDEFVANFSADVKYFIKSNLEQCVDIAKCALVMLGCKPLAWRYEEYEKYEKNGSSSSESCLCVSFKSPDGRVENLVYQEKYVPDLKSYLRELKADMMLRWMQFKFFIEDMVVCKQGLRYSLPDNTFNGHKGLTDFLIVELNEFKWGEFKTFAQRCNKGVDTSYLLPIPKDKHGLEESLAVFTGFSVFDPVSENRQNHSPANNLPNATSKASSCSLS